VRGVLLHDGDLALARQRAEEGLATAVELGMTPEVDRCRAILAEAGTNR